MQNQNRNSNSAALSATDPAKAATAAVSRAAQNDFVQKIVDKIKGSENILIALSRDPLVDEIAAAIGLTLYLDGIQKHATAIYSGKTPDELSFLQPGETFERTTDSLQDFIISLNKDKADHLRYKLEGDFVKVFITPYKTKLTEEDLTFSHGDYNVDFVIAINVASAANLDEALREHGRIMHDASAVNITTGDPGRFGEIEWSNPTASSLCEMITDLIFALQGSDETPLDRDVATALLTGIVAATDRFSNNRTNPDTLGVASKLMAMGADQQLITSNIHGNDRVKNVAGGSDLEKAEKPKVLGAMAVDHDEDVDNKAKVGATATNPAAQMAPNAGGAGSPEPTAVNGTNSTTSENVVVQPVVPGAGNTLVLPGMAPGATGAAGAAPVNPSEMKLPGVNIPVSASGGIANVASAANTNVAPVVNPNEMKLPGVNMEAIGAQGATASRPMATSEPTRPAERPVGTAIQPPVTEPKKPKNYAEMMEEALAEPMPGMTQEVVQPSTMDTLTARPSTSEATPVMGTGIGVPPVVEMAMDQGNNGATSSPVPNMEPVANPMNGTVLPPPPAPDVAGAGMMPPVLPPVQL